MQSCAQPVDLSQFAAELATLLYAERRRVKRLGDIADKMSEPEVARLLACHRKEAERHIERLERAFSFLELPPAERACVELDAIFTQGETACSALSGEARDEARLTVTRQLQSYRATAYRRTLAAANEAAMDRVATMLRANFQEETAAGIELDRYSLVRAEA